MTVGIIPGSMSKGLQVKRSTSQKIMKICDSKLRPKLRNESKFKNQDSPFSV